MTRDDVDEFSELLDASADASSSAVDDPARARRRRRARRVWLVIGLVLVLVLAGAGAYVAWALNASLPDPVATVRTPTVTPGAVASPSMIGTGSVVMTGAQDYLGPDGIRLTAGDDSPKPIASITKLITALVILDAHPLAGADDPGPTITFDKAAHDLYDEYYVQGATIAEMPTGTTMSLHDALATMLIPSASNYADAVSTWAFGSRDGYLSATRAWLAANDLGGTTIVEPTGISARNTSTPSDLVRIGQLAAANPAIAQIAATPSLTVNGPGTMRNTNDLLGEMGVTGLKTGNLGEGTFSLLYTASLDVGIGAPLSVVGVVLDGASRDAVDATVRTLFDSVRAGFHQVPLPATGTVIGAYETAWGSSAQLVVAESGSILTWSDTPIAGTLQVIAPTEYTDGEQVGSLTWTAGPNTVTVPVVVRGTIEPPSGEWRLTHPSELWAARD